MYGTMNSLFGSRIIHGIALLVRRSMRILGVRQYIKYFLLWLFKVRVQIICALERYIRLPRVTQSTSRILHNLIEFFVGDF